MIYVVIKFEIDKCIEIDIIQYLNSNEYFAQNA